MLHRSDSADLAWALEAGLSTGLRLDWTLSRPPVAVAAMRCCYGEQAQVLRTHLYRTLRRVGHASADRTYCVHCMYAVTAPIDCCRGVLPVVTGQTATTDLATRTKLLSGMWVLDFCWPAISSAAAFRLTPHPTLLPRRGPFPALNRGAA